MGILYVTSLRDGEGKTAFCGGLAHLRGQQGSRLALYKPVQIIDSTTSDGGDADALFFGRIQGASLVDGWPVAVEPDEAQGGLQPSTLEQVLVAFRKITGQADEIIVEGPCMDGGQDGFMAMASQLPEALDARVIVVVRYSSILQVEEVLDSARCLGHRLLGLVINGVPRYMNHDVQTTLVAPLLEQGVPVLGILPEERCLQGVTVGQLAEHVGGEFLLWEENRDQLVDHLMIGGNVLDWGVNYFGQSESKAVIVRGDRPDIQMAALKTPTRCLLLTGGHHPIQYVLYEAGEEEVPIVLVQDDTLTTAKTLESLFDDATIHHPLKVECFAQALRTTLDMQAIVKALLPD